MNSEAVLRDFDRVAREAEDAMARRGSLGCPEIEPHGLALVRMASQFPSLRDEFSQRFVRLIDEPALGPWELVAFCMHMLRWPEVRGALEERWKKAVAKPDHRSEPVLRSTLEAFDTSWQDAEMFPGLPRSIIEVSYSKAEFAVLLNRAAHHLIRRGRELYCDPPPPERFIFALTSGVPETGPGRCLDAHAILPELVAEDGSFRDWINLSPAAIVGDRTVLEISFADAFTKRLLVGALAFSFEPFHLLGPAQPSDSSAEEPLRKVALPEWPLDCLP